MENHAPKGKLNLVGFGERVPRQALTARLSQIVYYRAVSEAVTRAFSIGIYLRDFFYLSYNPPPPTSFPNALSLFVTLITEWHPSSCGQFNAHSGCGC